MGHSATCQSWGEVASCQCLTYHSNVVVKVPTDDDKGMWVLLDDVLGDIHNLSCPVFKLLLLPRLYVAVKDLDSMVGDL